MLTDFFNLVISYFPVTDCWDLGATETSLKPWRTSWKSQSQMITQITLKEFKVLVQSLHFTLVYAQVFYASKF